MGTSKRFAIAFTAAVAMLFTTVSVAGSASAAAPAPSATVTSAATAAPATLPAVTGVSANWVTLEGFVVGWVPLPVTTKPVVTGYRVTASNGQVCAVGNVASAECVFSSTKVPFGFKPYQRYTFTVAAYNQTGSAITYGPESAPSNSAGWFGAPSYPTFVESKATSDNSVAVKWIPDASTGGIGLSGYKVYYWPLNQDNQQKLLTSSTNSATLTGLTKSTWYVIAVQSCNYYGCSTADWSYAATTPAAASTSTTLVPRTLNGGTASTACWDAVFDGGSANSTSATYTKSLSACPAAVPPTTWPSVSAAAASSPNLPITTKFNARTRFSLANASYSMSYKWNDLGVYGGNFLYSRSTAPRVFTSSTPNVCTIITKNGQPNAHFLAPGTCTLTLTIPADDTYLASGPITDSVVVKP
jgi:hypothetical protein